MLANARHAHLHPAGMNSAGGETTGCSWNSRAAGCHPVRVM